MRIGSLLDVRRADCFRALEELADGSVDAVISDPPYGTTDCAWDVAVDWLAFWDLVARKLKPDGVVALFAAGKFTFDLWKSNPRWYRYDLVWHKTAPVGFLMANQQPLRSHESILIFAPRLIGSCYNPQKTVPTKKATRHARSSGTSIYHNHYDRIWTDDGSRHPTSVLKFTRERAGGWAQARVKHPTLKPLALMEWLVRSYSRPGDLVVDPFLGSGSTAEACLRNGRRFFGCEKNRTFYRRAVKRLEAAA